MGRPLFSDFCIRIKSRLSYARILVEMDLLMEFPNDVILEDEERCQQHQQVVYEWTPIRCRQCKKYGHEGRGCKIKYVWQAKHKSEEKEDVADEGTTNIEKRIEGKELVALKKSLLEEGYKSMENDP